MSGGDRHLGALDWARYSAGELRGWRGARLRRHLQRCERCRQLERRIASERAEFEASPDRATDLERLEARARALGPPATRPWRPLVLSLGATAGLALAAWVSIRLPGATPGDLLQGKGGDELTLFVEASSGAVALGPRCAGGDRVIARYRTERSHLLVLERDGRGAVQVVLPWNGASSERLTGAEGTAPMSWVLDGVPGAECFVAFFSDEPLEAGRVRGALDRWPDLPDVPGATVRTQCCEKESSR